MIFSHHERARSQALSDHMAVLIFSFFFFPSSLGITEKDLMTSYTGLPADGIHASGF